MDDSTKTNTPSTKRDADEDINSRSPKKPNLDVQEEGHFERLYYEALTFIQKVMEVSDNKLDEGVGTVIESFKYNKGNQFMELDFDDSANLCAFFYRYSQLSTELSRFKILEAIDKCEELQSRLIGNEINVVSVGGGPGCDVIGFFSAIYPKVKCNKLNVTLVDSNKRWRSVLNVVDVLLREGDFGNASRIFRETDASLSFICENVCNTGRQSTDYSEALKNADVILMKGLLSILSVDDKRSAVKDISQKIKKGAVLLFIDAPYYNFEDFGLKKVYTSCIQQSPQKLSEEVSQNFIVKGSYKKRFGSGIACKSKQQISAFIKRE